VACTATIPETRSGYHWNSVPSVYELIVFAGVSALLFVATINHFHDYRSVVHDFGDSGAYVSTAAAIRHWNLSGIQTKQFWGYPYLIAALSASTGVSEDTSLLIVSSVCSVLSVGLAFQLWGGWIAGLFAVLNFEWLQRSYLGGAEPLFVCLLFASFWAVRRQRWLLACCLASCATVTRPIGIFALVAIGITLLMKREFRKALLCTGISLGIGILYLAPFWVHFGDPLYQVHRYQTADWRSGSPLTWPFSVIAQSFLHNDQPWTNVVLTLGWVLFVLLGAAAMLRTDFRQHLRERPIEFAFAFLYIGFLFSYNSPEWARADFVRFAIPVLPFMLSALSEWIPRDRRILWVLGVVSPVLAAASALGIRNVIHALRG
jgi:hypothetical protein